MRRSPKSSSALYPLRFCPAYKNYPWGGDRIIKRFRRREPPGVYAESWEISDHPDGITTVANGPLKGMPFDQVLADHASAILGPLHTAHHFPLLVKILDARETLSVQVHPDRRVARRWGGEPKTETWYFLEVPPGAGVYAGWEPGVARSHVEVALRKGRIKKLLRWVPVLPGDTIFMPAGRVHAITAGCLILEVQQRANTTYRLYDWNRKDAHRRQRPLHIEEALRSIRWDDRDPVKLTPRGLSTNACHVQRQLLAECPYFRMERLQMTSASARFTRSRLTTCAVIFVSRGRLQLESGKHKEILLAGTTCLIPFALRSYTLVAQRAPCEAIIIMPTGL